MKKIISPVLILTVILTTTAFAHPFNDVKGHWAEAEIEKGYTNNVINGDGNGNFRPNDTITRGEFLKMVVALACDKISIANNQELVIPEHFDDGTHWASRYYNFAVQSGLVPAFETEVDGIYAGVMRNAEDYNKPITRWEMAYLLSCAMHELVGIKIDTDALKFTDANEIEKYPQSVTAVISTANNLGFMNGDNNGNFLPAASGTRAEAVAVINRMGDSLQDYIDSSKKEEEIYYENLEDNLVMYDDIPKGHPTATIIMEDNKRIVIELYPEYAPQTVANFVKLAKEGFYDGLTFHRVVEGFMAQGGDPKGDGSGGSGKYIVGEFAANGFDQNTLKHQKGVISMARSQAPNSASSQFFICYDDASFLDGQYAAFGKVKSGMDVLNSFTKVELAKNSSGETASPVKPIVIKKITVR